MIPQLSIVLAAAFALVGCAASPKQVSISELRVSMGLDPRDVADVAAQMAQSILDSNVLRIRSGDGRSILAFSTFRNNTALTEFDPNLLFNRVSVTLNRTGVAYVYSSNDPFVARHQDRVFETNEKISAQNELLEFTGSKKRIQQRSFGSEPQYTLGIELIESTSQVGKTSQRCYQIHMSVVDIARGVTVWEDLRDVAKRLR